MTRKNEARTFDVTWRDLAAACHRGNRAAADAVPRELAGMPETEPQTLAHALRRWLVLPPTPAELAAALEADARRVRDAEMAGLIF